MKDITAMHQARTGTGAPGRKRQGGIGALCTARCCVGLLARGGVAVGLVMGAGFARFTDGMCLYIFIYICDEMRGEEEWES